MNVDVATGIGPENDMNDFFWHCGSQVRDLPDCGLAPKSRPPRANSYFIAPTRTPSRDLYRAAVFSCSVPFWIALSSAETVAR
jgi:hypothetical protein